MNSTTQAGQRRSAASLRSVGRALDTVGATCVWDADQDSIVDAITDLLHLTWVVTNDDGEAAAPDLVLEQAVAHFEAERDGGDDLAAHSNTYDSRSALMERKAHLEAALARVQRALDGHPAPSADNHHIHSAELCTPPISR